MTARTTGDRCLHCQDWVPLTALAEDYAKRVDARVHHPHLEWRTDCYVRVRIEEVIPPSRIEDTSNPSRQKKFVEFLWSSLGERGWEGNRKGEFWKSDRPAGNRKH